MPLLRPGLRPEGLYVVSFVYMHAGTPFLKKGDMQMTLPEMDVPVNVVEWELFVPDRFRVDHFDGNDIDAGLISLPGGGSGSGGGTGSAYGSGAGSGGGMGGGTFRAELSPLAAAMPGQLAGRVLDQTGAPLPGALVTIESGGRKQQLYTASDGSYLAWTHVTCGQVTVSAGLSGFKDVKRAVQQTGDQVDVTLPVAGTAESVSVSAESSQLNVSRSDEARKARIAESQAPSLNVQNLQRRASAYCPCGWTCRGRAPRTGSCGHSSSTRRPP